MIPGTNINLISLTCLRVAALGNLMVFATIPYNNIGDWVIKWYLTVLFLETELVFLVSIWHQMITNRSLRPELKQWPTTTLVLRDFVLLLGYHIHILNILLVLVWLSSWNYITYLCGFMYSVLMLVGI